MAFDMMFVVKRKSSYKLVYSKLKHTEEKGKEETCYSVNRGCI